MCSAFRTAPASPEKSMVMLCAGMLFTANPCDWSQREIVAISSGAAPKRRPNSAAVIHLWKFGEDLRASDSTNSSSAPNSCSAERFN